MAAASAPPLAAQLTLRFATTSDLALALRRRPGQAGLGALCVQVLKYYELGDTVLLTLEAGEERLAMQASVAWRRPGYIGLRFQPSTAEENRALVRLRTVVGQAALATPPGPPVEDSTKPFSE
jgi:hypothetical protein